MASIRRLVLDVLKPHTPNLLDLAAQLADLVGIDGVDISLTEMDQKVENVKITLEGFSINFEEVERLIIQFGASIHSVDKVSAGSSLIEEVATQQD
ncbi:MAG: DUF211 domain-containing protein [Actinobacteria bacterium]|nr:DUF211 domain-containing protein [Actinomycetota bacterium]MCL6088316.1 DUF211 domain-containing protein [Actinomycetota bacterium]